MEATRLGTVGIVVENLESSAAINAVLHQYADIIVGRLGIPYRQRGVAIIALAVDGSMENISAMTGKLGQIPHVSVKSAHHQKLKRSTGARPRDAGAGEDDMYDVKSRDANEFIDDGEVRASLEEAARLAAVPGEVERILDRARACRGLSHREAAVLLRVDDETTLEKMYALAKGGEGAHLRQAYRLIRPPVPFQLLRQQLRVLRLSLRQQDRARPVDAGPGARGGPRSGGYGP